MIQHMTHKNAFTVMELLISIFIISLLIMIAVPTYLHYVRRSQYSAIVTFAEPYKNQVAHCAHELGGVVLGCNGGSHGIPANIPPGAGVGIVNSINVVNGVITVTPNTLNGITSFDTYVLTPTVTNNGITWSVSGGACTNALVSGC